MDETNQLEHIPISHIVHKAIPVSTSTERPPDLVEYLSGVREHSS